MTRREYEMKQEDLDILIDAIKEAKEMPYIVVDGIPPASPQEVANYLWRALGKRMGFKYMTVRPVEGKGERFFTAEEDGR